MKGSSFRNIKKTMTPDLLAIMSPKKQNSQDEASINLRINEKEPHV
jgi:hypothetical protein